MSATGQSVNALGALIDSDPRRVGPYRVQGRLGVGGMGVVYLARDRRGRPVAVKVLRGDLVDSPAFRERFTREIAAARRLDSSYVARFVAARPEADQTWFATEYIAGLTLEAFVAQRGPLRGDELRSFASAIAQALVAIKDAGLVHRDLKPNNVLLGRRGPKVIDFGIAFAADHTALTRTGQRVGTRRWMAPEQVRGEPVSAATDVFGWGALVAFAGTGAPPFGTGDSDAVLSRVAHATPNLDGLEPELAECVRAALAKAQGERPSIDALLQTIVRASDGADRAELARSVRTLVEQEWPDDVPVTDAPRMRRLRARRALIGAGVVVVAGGVATALALAPAAGNAHRDTRTATTAPVPTSTTRAAGVTTNRATTAPSTTTTTTLDPVVARKTADGVLRQDGYSPIGASFDTSAGLSVIVGVVAGNEHPAEAFFFVRGVFVGTDVPPWDSSKGVSLIGRDGNTVTLAYDLYRHDDANCCPSGGVAKVRFRWNGTKVVNLDPIPASNARNNGL